jgi:protein gp37
MVLQKIRLHPEHIFLFLTKDPWAYKLLDFPPNCWLGVTITRQAEMDAFADYLFDCSWEKKANLFLSIEPILEPVKLTITPDWLIIGAETGNCKDKVIPEPEWIYPLVFDSGIPVFMKENLQGVWELPLIRRFPEEMGYALGKRRL